MLRELNARMLLAPRAGDGFQIPYGSGCYFPDHSHVMASEHRNVMQIVPHLVHGLNEDLCDVMCRYFKNVLFMPYY